MYKFFQNLLQPNYVEDMPFVDKRNVQITHIINLALIGLNIVYLIPAIGADHEKLSGIFIITIFSIAPNLLILYFTQIRYYILARYILIFYFSIFLFIVPYFTGIYTGINLHFASLIIGSVLLFRSQLVISILFIFTSSLLLMSTFVTGTPANFWNLRIDFVMFWVNGFAVITLLYVFVNAFKQESENYQKEVEAKNRELNFKNDQINESISYAKTIQEAMLPELGFLQQFQCESFVYFQPKDIVSGDFYWFQEVDGAWIIAVGDCTGHGIPGALMSMLGISFLEQIVVEKEITQPDEILENLDKVIKKALHQDQTDNQDGMDISLIKIDINNQKIQFAGANNPLWHICEEKIIEYKGTKRGIGGRKHLNPRPFQLHSIDYHQGSAVYLFSDGYKDQFGGVKSSKFGSKKLREFLLDIYQKPSEEQKALVESNIKNWMQLGKEVQTDDMLVLGCKL